MKQIKRVVFTSLTVVLLTSCTTVKKSNINNLSVDSPVISNSFKDEYLNAINSVRSSNQICGEKGLYVATSALRWSNKLYGAAYEHSNDLAITNKKRLSHRGSGQFSDLTGIRAGSQSTLTERLASYNYKGTYYGENVGAGTFTDTPTKLVAQLMRSSGHCANIMNPKFTEVGMAMVKKSSSKYTYYWTQNFGTPPN